MIVLPTANTKNSETFTATAVNDHSGKKMSVSGTYHDNPHGTVCEDIPYGCILEYTGLLNIDENGVIVTYTEELDASVDFDINRGDAAEAHWNETSETYISLGNGLYSIAAGDIDNNQYKPADPTCGGMAFIGWTACADIKGHTDFSGDKPVTWGNEVIIPGDGETILDVIRRDYLWNFDRPASDAYDVTLYAIWSEAVTVTFDLARSGSNLHRWIGPETTDVPGAYVFYRSDKNSSTVTYTLLKGERVPKPVDPLSDPEKTNWYFVQWLTENNTTDSYRDNPVDNLGEDTVFRNYAFDFSQPVTDNVTLVTSWTTRVPQVFTFTVENHVNGGNPNDEFEYTIAVSNEKADKSNKLTVVDNPWGSTTTYLKNNESYTVRITVRTIYAWNSNDNFGGQIEVIDRDGRIVKSRAFNMLSTLGQKYYSSSYQLDLTITQTTRGDYETYVAVEDVLPVDSITYSRDQDNSSYTFKIRQGKHYPNEQENTFVSGAYNRLTVVFTNTGEIYVAPTSYISRHTPFILLMVFGIVLTMLSGVGVIRKKRLPDSEPEKARTRSHPKRVKYRTPLVRGAPPSAPPCPRANLWTQTQGPPGRRGDPGG